MNTSYINSVALHALDITHDRIPSSRIK